MEENQVYSDNIGKLYRDAVSRGMKADEQTFRNYLAESDENRRKVYNDLVARGMKADENQFFEYIGYPMQQPAQRVDVSDVEQGNVTDGTDRTQTSTIPPVDGGIPTVTEMDGQQHYQPRVGGEPMKTPEQLEAEAREMAGLPARPAEEKPSFSIPTELTAENYEAVKQRAAELNAQLEANGRRSQSLGMMGLAAPKDELERLSQENKAINNELNELGKFVDEWSQTDEAKVYFDELKAKTDEMSDAIHQYSNERSRQRIQKQVEDEGKMTFFGRLAKGLAATENPITPEVVDVVLSPEENELRVARNEVRNAQKQLQREEMRMNGEQKGLAFVRGLETANYYELIPVIGMADAATILALKQDMEEGKELTDTQKMLLDAMELRAGVDFAYQDNNTMWERIGQSAPEQLMFTLQFVIGGGLTGATKVGERVAAKSAQKAAIKYARKGVNSGARRFIGGTVLPKLEGMAVSSTIQTFANPLSLASMAEDFERRYAGDIYYDNQGNLHVFDNDRSAGQAAYQAIASAWIENFTEYAGGNITKSAKLLDSKMFDLAGKFDNVMKTVGAGKIQDVFRIPQQLGRLTQIGSAPEEFLEEELGSVMNALMATDANRGESYGDAFKRSVGQSFSGEQQLETFLSCAVTSMLLGGGGNAVNAVGNAGYRRQINQEVEKSKALLGKVRGIDMRQLDNAIENGSIGDISAYLKEQSDANGWSQDEQGAAVSYVMNRARQIGMKHHDDTAIEEAQAEMRQQAEDMANRWDGNIYNATWKDNEGNEQPVTIINGRIHYTTRENGTIHFNPYTSSGMIAIRLADGTKKQVPSRTITGIQSVMSVDEQLEAQGQTIPQMMRAQFEQEGMVVPTVESVFGGNLVPNVTTFEDGLYTYLGQDADGRYAFLNDHYGKDSDKAIMYLTERQLIEYGLSLNIQSANEDSRRKAQEDLDFMQQLDELAAEATDSQQWDVVKAFAARKVQFDENGGMVADGSNVGAAATYLLAVSDGSFENAIASVDEAVAAMTVGQQQQAEGRDIADDAAINAEGNANAARVDEGVAKKIDFYTQVRNALTERMEGQQEAKAEAMEATPVSQMEVGQEFPVMYDGQQAVAVVVGKDADGRNVLTIRDQEGNDLESGIDDWTDEQWERFKSRPEEVALPTQQTEQQESAEIEQKPTEIEQNAPEIEQKEPENEQQEEVPVSPAQQNFDGLVQKYGDKAGHKIDVTAEDKSKTLDKAKKALEKAQTDYDDAPIGKEEKAEAALQKAQEEYNTALAEKQEWDEVKAVKDRFVAERLAAQQAADEERHAQAVAEEEARRAEEERKAREREATGANNVAPNIREKWEGASKVEGNADEITLANGERIAGHYVLVESGAASASHDALNGFAKTEGFPLDENEQSVNDRDYERDQNAQQITRQIAAEYDSRALQQPVVVSQDGVVLSGNGRTMEGEIAAAQNTDGAYVDYLRKYAPKYGFTPEQVEGMTHPRVVFVPDASMPYTAETFAKFNQQEMKGQSKTEQAVKLGKLVDDATFGRIIRSINRFDTLGDFYADTKATAEAIGELLKAGAINQMQHTEMFDGDAISAQGREILENMLIGKAFESNPDAVRQLAAYKSLRQSVITALAEISNNIALGEYSLESELSEAIALAYNARKNGYKAGDAVSEFARQGKLFETEEDATAADYTNATVLMLADLLNDNRVTRLKKAMAVYNKEAQQAAGGQSAMAFDEEGNLVQGGVKTKQEILNEVLLLLQHGTETEQQQALDAAREQRKAAAEQGTGVQENGDTGEGGEGERGVTSPLGYDAASNTWTGVPDGLNVISDGQADRNGIVVGYTPNTNIELIHDTKSGVTSARVWVEDEQAETPALIISELEKEGMEVESGGEGYYVDFDTYEKARRFEIIVRTIEKSVHSVQDIKDAATESRVDEPPMESAGEGTELTPPGPLSEGELGPTDEAVSAANEEVDTNPTEAQKEAGNYKKGHVTIDGFDISIENPAGSTRSGTDAQGNPWSVTMHNSYGYIRMTEGVDGDHIDIFLSDHIDDWNGTVYVVDQVNEDGSFDEHKVMYGFNSAEEAREAYLSNYSEGWQGLGTITGVSREEFKKWVDSSHRKTKAFADYKSVQPTGGKTNDGTNEAALPTQQTEQPIDDSDIDALIEDYKKKAAAANKIWSAWLADPSGKPADYGTTRDEEAKAYGRVREALAGVPEEKLAEMENTNYGDSLLNDLIKEERNRRNEQKEIEQRFVDGLAKQGEIGKPTKPVSIEKILPEFTSRDDQRPIMNCIYYDPEGYAVASDAYILIASKSQYDPKQEGKMVAAHKIKGIAEKGDEVEGKFMKWRNVISQAKANSAEIDLPKLRDFLAGVKELMKGSKENAAVQVRMPNGDIIGFDPEHLLKFVQGAEAMGVKEIEYIAPNRAITGRSEDGIVLLMPKKISADYGGREFYYDLSDRTDKTDRTKGTEKAEKTDKTETEPKKQPKAPGKAGSQKIDDVGEKIAGARKDMRREIAKGIGEATVQSLIELPFSKAFKKPNLKKAVESGALREEDAFFFDAWLASTVNTTKPKVTQQEVRRKKYNPNAETNLERWAKQTFEALDFLRTFVEADETERDRIIGNLTAEVFPKREAQLAEFERIRELNKGRNDNITFGDCLTPNPVWVTYQVMQRLGYAVGDKLDIPFGILRGNTTGTSYYLYNTKDEHSTYIYPNSLEEGIDAIVWLARIKRGDTDIQHPVSAFYTTPTKSEMGDSGRFRVIWGGWSSMKNQEFDSKEAAEAFAAKKKDAYVNPIQEVKRRFGYKIMFRNPLTGERTAVSDMEFDTKAEAEAYMDGNYEAMNDGANEMLAKESGTKKEVTADDVVGVTVTYGKDGWQYAAVINAAYANNMGMPLVLQEFKTRGEAKAYADSVKDKVFETYRQYKAKQKEFVYFGEGEDTRIGEDYRGGKDVTAEDFMNAFGFRGVQFGNWTNQADRQMAVNQAYDAFMDLAKLLGMSPRAMSLNGELGIAFGARGSGNANAHYEYDEVVINLTKTRGAGSLAHEWWHALDNYFARRGGMGRGMVTDVKSIAMRDELRKAYDRLIDEIEKSNYYKRSVKKGDYWGRMHEVTARLLAEWVNRELKQKGELNTFLARGVDTEKFVKMNYELYKMLMDNAGREAMPFEEYKELDEALSGMPYPSDKEIDAFSDALRNIFETIEEREEDGKTVLYQKVGSEQTELTEEETALRDALVGLEKAAGIEVIDDVEEGQRELDEANELSVLSKRKSVPEIAVPGENTPFKATVISETDAAKIAKKLETFIQKSKNPTLADKNNFLGDIAKELGARRYGSGSQYLTFETKRGEVTLRLADHNVTVSNFDNRERKEGISIVISRKPNEGIKGVGDAHIVEFFYSDKELRKSDGTPYSDIARSIQQALYSGEYKDTTGLAKPQEVNAENLKQQKEYHGSGADFDAFDHSHMGEGEGSQAFGYGTYLTDSQGIAQDYAKRASRQRYRRVNTGYNGKEIFYKGQKVDLQSVNPLKLAYDMIDNEGTVKKALAQAERLEGMAEEEEMKQMWRDAAEILRHSKKSDFTARDADLSGQRYVYDVEIPEDDGTNYIDIDKPLTDAQVEKVVAAFESQGWKRKEMSSFIQVYNDNGDVIAIDRPSMGVNGAKFYQELSQALGSGKKASEFLASAGFVGITYPAGTIMGNGNGATNHVIFNEADAKITGKTRFFRTSDGTAYGFTKGGRIYIDPRIATSETPIHEYAHLWAEALRKANPEEWRNVVELMRGTSIWEEVRRNYPELETDDEIAEETLAHYSGRRGAERLREAQRQAAFEAPDMTEAAKAVSAIDRVRQALKRFWKAVADFLNIHYNSAEEVADRVMRDLLERVNPKEVAARYGAEVGDKRAREQKKVEAATGLTEAEEAEEEETPDMSISGEGIPYYRADGISSLREEEQLAFDAVMDALGNAGIEVVMATQEDVEKLKASNRSIQDSKGTVRGWVGNDGRIYLTSDGMSAETPIHEYTHLWAEALQMDNPELWEQIKGLLKDTPEWKRITSMKEYSNLKDDDRIAGEVLAHISGKKNAERMEAEAKRMIDEAPTLEEAAKAANLLGRMRDALKKFWTWVGKTLLGKKGNINIDQVSNMVLADLTNGVDPFHPRGGKRTNRTKRTDASIESEQNGPNDIERVNQKFNDELQQQIEGTLPSGHVYDMGMPSAYLRSTGIPNLPIRLQSSILNKKSDDPLHPYKLEEVKDLVKLIQKPLAIFAYGDKTKAQNLMIGISQPTAEGKQFLVGLALNPDVKGKTLEINSVRNVFPKNYHDWIHWIIQGKMLRVDDRESIKAIIDALRINPVDYISDNDLDSAANIVENFENPQVEGENFSDVDLSIVGPDNQIAEEYNRMTGYNSDDVSGYVRGREELLRSFFDDLRPLEQLQQLVEKALGRKLRDSENAYGLATLLPSLNKAMMDKAETEFMLPVLRQSAKMVKAAMKSQHKGLNEAREMLNNYLLAKHGLERNEWFYQQALANDPDAEEEDKAGLRGLAESLGENPDDYKAVAEQVVADFEDMFDATEIGDYWASMKALTDRMLEISFESGMINKDTFESLKARHKYYVPLRGFADGTSGDLFDYVSRHPHFQSVFKKMKGRKSKADDPLANLYNMLQSAIVIGNQNKVMQNIYNLAVNAKSDLLRVNRSWYVYNDATDEWEERFPDIPEDATADEIDAIMKQFDADMQQLKQQGKAEQYLNKMNLGKRVLPYQAKEHEMTAYINGRKVMMHVAGNPLVAQQLNKSNTQQLGWFAETVQGLTRFASRINTSLSPAFMFTNAARDIGFSLYSATVTGGLKKNLQMVGNLFRAGWVLPRLILTGKMGGGITKMFSPTEAAKIEQWWNEFLDNGGETGFTNTLSAEKAKGQVDDMIRRMINYRSKDGQLRLKKATLGVIETMGRYSEDISRFAAYCLKRAEGETVKASVNEAKNVTVNFNVKGGGNSMVARFVAGCRSCYSFFNASLQGINRMGRLAKENPKAFAACLMACVVQGAMLPWLNMALFAMLGGDDDDWEKYEMLSEYTANHNLIIFVGNHKFLKIPYSQELAPFAAMGNIWFRQQMGWNHGRSIASQIGNMFLDLSPVNIGESKTTWGKLAKTITPTIAMPLTEWALNENFTASPIEKRYEWNKFDSGWEKAYESRTSKWLIDATRYLDEKTNGTIDINPSFVEHIATGMLGGIGRSGDNLMKYFSDGFQTQNAPYLRTIMFDSKQQGYIGAVSREYGRLAYEVLPEVKHDVDRADMLEFARLANTQDYQIANVVSIYKTGKDLLGNKTSFQGIDKLEKAFKKAQKESDGSESANEYLQAMRDQINEMKMEMLDAIDEVIYNNSGAGRRSRIDRVREIERDSKEKYQREHSEE